MGAYKWNKKGMHTIPFGKYCGRSFNEIPLNYLEYIVRQDWLDEDLRDRINSNIRNRKRNKNV